MVDPDPFRLQVQGHRDARVLLFEQDPTLADMYTIGLAMRGLVVDLVQDGGDGMERALSGAPPDVIVVDLDLPRVEIGAPRKDGLDLLSALRSIRLTRAVPVVALSEDVQSWDDALDEVATESFPRWRITPPELARRIVQLLDAPAKC